MAAASIAPVLKHVRIGAVFAWVAHAWTWGAGLWLGFGPVYQGVSVAATPLGGSQIETAKFTESLVEANGLWVVWLLLVPVLLSGLPLLALRFTDSGQLLRKAILWLAGLALLASCAVAIFSIGLFYLPAALALLCAAAASTLERPREQSEPYEIQQ